MGIELSVWRIHRRIGMSGGLLSNALLRETGRTLTPDGWRACCRTARGGLHAACRLASARCPVRAELLAGLTSAACRGRSPPAARIETPAPALACSGLPDGDPDGHPRQVGYAKPDPDLFLAAAGAARRRDPRHASSSATASGTCSPPGAPAPSGSACCRAATAGMSSSTRRVPRLRGPGRPARHLDRRAAPVETLLLVHCECGHYADPST